MLVRPGLHHIHTREHSGQPRLIRAQSAHEAHPPALEIGERGVHIGLEDDVHSVQVGQQASPGIAGPIPGAAFEHRAALRKVRPQDERARTHPFARGIRSSCAQQGRGVLGDRGGKLRVALGEHEKNALRRERDDRLDRRERGGRLVAGRRGEGQVAQALEGEDHVLGVEGVTVVERHVGAQGERPTGRTGLLPTQSQPRTQRAVPVHFNQPVVDLVQKEKVARGGGGGRIEILERGGGNGEYHFSGRGGPRRGGGGATHLARVERRGGGPL